MNDSNALPHQDSNEQIFALVQSELTTQRRAVQRLALLGAVIMTGIITALWVTEPRPLPLRLHLSFAAMSAIGATWIGILSNILVRKNCPIAWDRIATAWAGLIGGVGFAVGSTSVCFMRAEPIAGTVFAIASAVFVALCGFNVRKAYRWQNELRQRIIAAEGLAFTVHCERIGICIDITEEIVAAIRAEPVAWEYFQPFPHLYKRIRIGKVVEV